MPRGASDRLILGAINEIRGPDVLMVLINGTALARHAIRAMPEVSWSIFTMEHFYLESLIKSLESDEDDEILPTTNIELFCNPDLPDRLFDSVVFPTDSRSASELTRDILLQIESRLKQHGRLVISTNNPKDHWLHTQLKSIFGKITVIKDGDGVCYIARKSAKEPKQKDFQAKFAFRDGERLIRCTSRPGVFSHRRVDPGARALIRSLDLLNEDDLSHTLQPRRIVEVGCGSGAVIVAACLRYPDAQSLAVDSHARAIQSTEQTAALNEVTNLNVMLTSNGVLPDAGSYDLFLANPPYYSDYRISEVFLQSASESLKSGGRLHLVTKLTDWHQERMKELFNNVETHRFGEYDVITGINR